MLPDGGVPAGEDTSGADPSSAPEPAAQKWAIRRQLGEEFLQIF